MHSSLWTCCFMLDRIVDTPKRFIVRCKLRNVSCQKWTALVFLGDRQSLIQATAFGERIGARLRRTPSCGQRGWALAATWAVLRPKRGGMAATWTVLRPQLEGRLTAPSLNAEKQVFALLKSNMVVLLMHAILGLA